MEFDRLVVSFLVDEVVGGFFISVPPGHVACVYDRGRGVLPKVWGPGLHFKIPFWQIAKLFNAQILEYSIRDGFDVNNKDALGDLPIEATTKDGEDVTIEGSVMFRIDKQNAPELWENIGEHMVSKIVRPASRSKIATTFSELTLDQIKHNRVHVEEKIKSELQKSFEYRGINCEGFLLATVKLAKSGKTAEVLLQAETSNFGSLPKATEQPILN